MADDTASGSALHSRSSAGGGVTEDEAALYDRQIRLWGLEAQGKIRTAHILVVNLDGLTTEAIKNWILAGFFWREEDIGKDRLTTASKRMQILNPNVTIELLPSEAIDELFNPSSSRLADLNPNFIIIGVPSGPQLNSSRWSRRSLAAANHHARSNGIPFYCLGSQGLNGWAFSDLGNSHNYLIDKPEPLATEKTTSAGSAIAKTTGEPSNPIATPASTPAKKLEKRTQSFVTLDKALQMSWKGLTRAQLRKQKPTLGYFGVLAVWDCIEKESLPTSALLKESIEKFVKELGAEQILVNASTNIDSFSQELSTYLSEPGEFSPTCAILGGVASQDVLNAIGGREAPIVNWFQFDGASGAGIVHALNIA